MTISASAHAREWQAEHASLTVEDAAAALAGQNGVPAAARARKLLLLPYQVLLIVWFADMIVLALAVVLSRVAAGRGVSWNFGDLLMLALLPLCWLATCGRDVSRPGPQIGDRVSLRVTARELMPAWPKSFGFALPGVAAAVIVSAIVQGGGWAAISQACAADAVWLGCLFACGMAFLTIGRPIVVAGIAGLGRADLDSGGNLRLRALVIGSHADAARVVADLENLPLPPVRVLGAVDAQGTLQEAGTQCGGELADRNLRGHAAAAHGMCELVRRAAIDTVLIACPRDGQAGVAAILRTLRAAPVDIWLLPDADAGAADSAPSDHGDLPYKRLRRRPLSIAQQAAKKAEDMVAGTVLLLLAAPVMLAIAGAIRLESSGPIFFRQQRRGYGDRLITVLKFRTMYETMRDDHAAQQTVRGDRRVTRVGRILRRLSLDELPQLINVMRGEMSVVGPRPHALQTKAAGQLFDAVVEDYAARHRVKPGITGWAQVNGWRGETDTVEKIVKRVEFDLHYIGNWSLARDLEIICKTVVRIAADRTAY